MTEHLENTDPQRPVLVLFRHDLRISDNLALSQAAKTGKPLIPVFVFDEQSKGIRPPGGAKRWWLHHSLVALGDEIKKRGGELILRRGITADVVDALIAETGADMVLWNRRHDPGGEKADREMVRRLESAGIAHAFFDGHLLHDPLTLETSTGRHYRVFSAFERALMRSITPRSPVPAPGTLRPAGQEVHSEQLNDWMRLPTGPDWASGLRDNWTPGEVAAKARLAEFVENVLAGYRDERDMPALAATSRLSPHLTHGEISPFQIWHALEAADAPEAAVGKFRSELLWREFCWHLLVHNPDMPAENIDRSFDRFEWRNDREKLAAWRRGATGYPLVDAGMRELWRTGWMHNRVRMVVASFLTKHLRVHWREGENWFWDTLVDADEANNPANWQWVAGSGADAAPYFRIFNPVLQGQKFDPAGRYVREYVPEIANLPDRYIHRPWEAPKNELARAGITLDETYPEPVVEHRAARQGALDAFYAMRDSG